MSTIRPLRLIYINYYKLLIYIGFLVFSPFVFRIFSETFLNYRAPIQLPIQLPKLYKKCKNLTGALYFKIPKSDKICDFFVLFCLAVNHSRVNLYNGDQCYTDIQYFSLSICSFFERLHNYATRCAENCIIMQRGVLKTA